MNQSTIVERQPPVAGLPFSNSSKPALVLGIGNLLMGDEGVGVHAIEYLVKETLPPGIRLLDGGTGGFHLLSLFQEYDPIVIIDATMDGKEAGTIMLTEPRFASEFPKTLSAHDIGLRDLLESATLIGPLPRLFLIAITICEIRSMTIELSPLVRSAIPRLIDLLRNIPALSAKK